MWLIPIHRPDKLHWVFVLAAVREQKLFFFDSLASNSGWRRNIIVSLSSTRNEDLNLTVSCRM
jgi:Ulp1 family protease